MYKFVEFPLSLDGSKVEYPDNIELFSAVFISDGMVHAKYTGNLDLEQSSIYLSSFKNAASSKIKSAAYLLIEQINGAGGWRNQRAQDAAAMGDSSEMESLIQRRQAIRDWSNAAETALNEMTCEHLENYEPELPVI